MHGVNLARINMCTWTTHTQSNAFASEAQTRGHWSGVMVALLARAWMSARSSSMLRFVLKVSVVDEQLIQPAARDLYAPVC